MIRRLIATMLWSAVLLVTAAPAMAQVNGAINSPGNGATVMQPFTISGWAIHGGGSGTGINAVRISDCSGACVVWGMATYGIARPDVAAAHGAQFLNSGYTFVKAGLTPGKYYLKVETRSTINGAWYLYGHWYFVQAQPEHTLQTPVHGQSLTSPVAISGWAIDATAPSGTGVSVVSVATYPNAGSGQLPVWINYATYGGNRPDVAASHGERFRYSGYALSTSSFGAGPHYIGVSAFSPHTQVWTGRIVTAYIDTPTVPLTLDRPGTGTGGVTATGLSCPGGSMTQALPCGASYPLHTVRTLTAVPDPGSTFAGWGGACTGAGTCQVTLSTARLVTASFSKTPNSIATRYYHTDVVGSVRAITDETGAVVIRNDYRPFGEDTQPLTGDPMRFAGKELDPETAMQYFDARYYRNTWGRFTSVDPLHVGAAMTHPQQWNRYAYAGNNPLKWADPTGMAMTCTEAGECRFQDTSYVSGTGVAAGISLSGTGMGGLGGGSSGDVSNVYYFDSSNHAGLSPGWCATGYRPGEIYGTAFECGSTSSQSETKAPIAAPKGPATDPFVQIAQGVDKQAGAFVPVVEVAVKAASLILSVNPLYAAIDCWLQGCGAGEAVMAIMPFSPKILRQMGGRGWTSGAIEEAITSGQRIPAVNQANGNAATRYVHPRTGQSVVVDDVTGDVFHVGGPGFRYGPGSGDLP